MSEILEGHPITFHCLHQAHRGKAHVVHMTLQQIVRKRLPKERYSNKLILNRTTFSAIAAFLREDSTRRCKELAPHRKASVETGDSIRRAS